MCSGGQRLDRRRYGRRIEVLFQSRQLGILPAQDSVGDKAMKAAFNLKTQVAKKLKER